MCKARDTMTDWVNEIETRFLCARASLVFLSTSSLLLRANVWSEEKLKDVFCSLCVCVISHSTVFLSLFGNRNQFARANGCSRGSIYKSVSHPFIKIKARPKRQERRQPMGKLHQTKVYKTNDREGAWKKTTRKPDADRSAEYMRKINLRIVQALQRKQTRRRCRCTTEMPPYIQLDSSSVATFLYKYFNTESRQVEERPVAVRRANELECNYCHSRLRTENCHYKIYVVWAAMPENK